MIRRHGFTLVELLVATAIVLSLMAGLLAILVPGPAASKARAAAIDMQQRLRAATEAIGAGLAAAGTGPINGAFGYPLAATAASLLPQRVGPRGDPAGTVRSDALTILAAPGIQAAASLAADWVPGSAAPIAPSPGCPSGDASCGFRADASVLLVDGRGQADLFRIESVAGAWLTLVPLGVVSGRSFPVGTAVVPVVVTTFYFKAGVGTEGGQLMVSDGNLSALPLVDHVTRLWFQFLGEPRAPVLTGSGPGGARASYGPSPPPPLADDPRDTWPAGENCTFASTPGGQASRLATLRPGTGLVPLPAAILSDGPWCPDAESSARLDADLFRVRAVRVILRLEAVARDARGSDAGLFAHPGSSPDRASPAADQEVVFDVVPRSLQRGR